MGTITLKVLERSPNSLTFGPLHTTVSWQESLSLQQQHLWLPLSCWYFLRPVYNVLWWIIFLSTRITIDSHGMIMSNFQVHTYWQWMASLFLRKSSTISFNHSFKQKWSTYRITTTVFQRILSVPFQDLSWSIWNITTILYTKYPKIKHKFMSPCAEVCELFNEGLSRFSVW